MVQKLINTLIFHYNIIIYNFIPTFEIIIYNYIKEKSVQ